MPVSSALNAGLPPRQVKKQAGRAGQWEVEMKMCSIMIMTSFEQFYFESQTWSCCAVIFYSMLELERGSVISRTSTSILCSARVTTRTFIPRCRPIRYVFHDFCTAIQFAEGLPTANAKRLNSSVPNLPTPGSRHRIVNSASNLLRTLRKFCLAKGSAMWDSSTSVQSSTLTVSR